MMLLRDATIAHLAIFNTGTNNRMCNLPMVIPDWNWSQELLRQPAWREQLIAELDGRPIGCIQNPASCSSSLQLTARPKSSQNPLARVSDPMRAVGHSLTGGCG